MKVSDFITCKLFPCKDVDHAGFLVPNIEVDPNKIHILMISEAAPANPKDYYYTGTDSLFAQTTVLAFNDAGVKVSSIPGLVEMGVYFTSAVKCAKTTYGIATSSIKECSSLLEKELALFPNVKAYLLMGDVAIKAVNAIARRTGEKPVIPAGSTYKIHGQVFTWRGKKAFPSYLPAGPSIFIEKSKRRMIAEDIATALRVR